MSDLFVRHPRLLILTLLLSVVAGLAAWIQLPRLEDPTLIPRFAMVYTPYPGAIAEHVESRVTDKLEDSLKKFQELKTLESTSRFGMSVLVLELDDWVQPEEIAPLWSKIKDELEQVSRDLPKEAGKPDFVDEESEAYTMILGLAWTAETPPPASLLKRLGEELQDSLRAVHGTEFTRLFGAPEEEVLVEVNNARLQGLGLGINDIAAEIRALDAKTPAGLLRNGGSNLPIEVEGDPKNISAIQGIAISHGATGEVIRLGDFAQVSQGYREPMSELVLLDGSPGVALAIRMDPSQRIDHWEKDVQQRLIAFQQTLPRGLELRTVFSQAKYVEARFQGLWANLLLSTLLVLIVSFVMLGWRAAILVGLALPMTSLLVLAGMNALGVPLHQISVSGMIIALGMLIDNAIIMVDEIRNRLSAHNEGTISVVRNAVRFLAVPLLGSTLTTVLAFSPLLLMEGPTGEFVGSIALTVTLALIASLFLSLTVLPALAVRSKPTTNSGLQLPRISKHFQKALLFLFRHPKTALLLAILPSMAGFYSAAGLTEQFFPPAERDQFQIQLILPRQVALEETRRTVQEADLLLHQNPAVDEVHWFLGTSAPQFYYNMMTGQEGATNFAQALVQLKDGDDLAQRIQTIQSQLDDAFPGATALALQLEQGPPFAAPIELTVTGPNLEQLEEIGINLRLQLSQLPGVTHAVATLENGQPKLWLRPKKEDARLAGMGRRDLANTLQSALEGVVAGSLIQDTEELPIRVRLDAPSRDTLHALRSLEFTTRDGAVGGVPLASIADFELTPTWASIPHRSGDRANSIRGFLQAGLLPAQALEGFQRKLEASNFQLPAGYSLAYGGEAAERDGAVGSLLANVGILATLMIAVLVLSFSSFRAAAMIGAVALLAAGLGLASLSIAGYPFGFMAILGILGLVGVAINDSIVVLAALREDSAAASGDAASVLKVVLHATRHVLTTTVTTVAGFLPLILGGSLFWAPLAVVIGGGVLGATLIALVFIPAGHILLARRVCAQEAAKSNMICTPLNKLWQTMPGTKLRSE